MIVDEGGDESITVETRMNDAAETTADLSHSSFFFKDQPVQEEVLPLISTDKSSDTGDGQTINELDKANKEAIRLSNVTDKCFIKVRKMDVAKLILKQKLRTDPEVRFEIFRFLTAMLKPIFLSLSLLKYKNE